VTKLITNKQRTVLIILLLALVFLFRLWYGLSSPFWTGTEDEKQIYLIGLKFYTTRAWPWFGPDVTPTIQIPGALQGLLVGLPFFVAPIAEAPYVLLNLLSFASLCLLAWYTTRRLPEIPKWIIWTWLMLAPWTLNLSTNIFNPSYVLTGGVLFFVAFLELFPPTTRNLIAPRIAWLMSGFALGWVMQLHMSWVILVPFIGAALYARVRRDGRAALLAALWFIPGALVVGSLLIPTYLRYGLHAGTGDTAQVVVFNYDNLKRVLNPVEGILGRFLSFASFEVRRFIGGNTQARIQFVRAHLWTAPFVIFLDIVGLTQPLLLVILWFKRRHTERDWPAIKNLTAATLALLYVSFLFSLRPPYSHTFYVTLPLAMIYSFYCWSPYLARRRWQIFAAVFLACGLVIHVGVALHNRAHTSLYTNRAALQTAIEQHDYHLLGERRAGARY
jgi:hypothetical protein